VVKQLTGKHGITVAFVAFSEGFYIFIKNLVYVFGILSQLKLLFCTQGPVHAGKRMD